MELLERVKRKALEAFNGIGQAFTQNVVKPTQTVIYDWGTQHPQQTQQITRAPQDVTQNVAKNISDVLATLGKQSVSNVAPIYMPKAPTLSQVTENPVIKTVLPGLSPLLKGDIKGYADVLNKPLTPNEQTEKMFNMVIGATGGEGKLITDEVGNVINHSGINLMEKEIAPVVKKTADLFTKAGAKAGATVEKIVDDSSNPFKSATNFGSKPNKYMNLVGEAPRIFKKYFGGQWENVKKTYFDPLDYAKADAVNFKNTFNKTISDLKIKAGSRTSALIQQFGEGKVSADELIRKVGSKEADKIANADRIFREVYDTSLEQINALRTKAGLEPIARREDYYRHMNENGGTFWDSLVNGGARGEKSTSIGKQRLGDKTKFDAVKGFSDYIERVAHAGFIEPQAVNLEHLITDLSLNKNTPEGLVKELANYTKTQIRGIRDPLSSSEALNTVAGIVNKAGATVRANRIIGNISSILAQSLNLPLAISDTGVGATLKGMFNFPKNLKLINESPFIKDRLYSQPLKFSTGITKLKGVGGKVLQEADGAASRLITSMYYEKALSQGLKGEEAIKWAGDQARLTIGGRGIGDFSKFQTSPAGQFIAPFTLEVQSGLNKLGEKVAAGQVKAVVGYFVMTTGINDAYEKLTGYRPLPDPIETALDMYRSATGTGGKNQSWLKVAGRAIAGATEFMPIAQNALAFGYPIVSEFLKDGEGNSYLPDSRDVFGSDDPTRFGSASMYLPTDSVITGNKPLDIGLNTALQYTPTGYGGQVKKTLSGLIAEAKGYTQSKKGNVLHPLNQDVPTAVQTATFGPWSTGESKKFFDNENSRGLTKKQSDVFKTASPEYRDSIFKSAQQMDNPDKKSNIIDTLLGTNKTTESGDTLIWKNDNGNDVTVNLTQKDYSGKTGIAGYKQDTGNANKAVQIWGAPNDQIPDSVKTKAYEKLGFKPDDVRYAYKASFTVNEKTAYIVDKELPHAELLKALTTGRVESIKGQYFASDGVLDNLVDEGLISKDEAKYLKKIKISKDGKLATSSIQGTGLSASKIRSYITSLNSLFKKAITTQPAKATSAKSANVPKLKFPEQQSTGKTKTRWFDSY